MDNERNMILEKWAIINLNSSEAEMLEKKLGYLKKFQILERRLMKYLK